MARIMTRREFLCFASGLLGTTLTGCRSVTQRYSPSTLSRDDDAFLEVLERASFQFFLDNTHPNTGLVRDRSRVDGQEKREVASIAAAGFGLSAQCIAAERGWMAQEEARVRVLTALRFLRDHLPNEHGFFFHFINWRTGERVWKCELSSIDTALLLAGVLTCRSYFADPEIREAAGVIYDRVDWNWMGQGALLLRMGWKPEDGFLTSTWDTYSEHMLLYLLAIGANRHALAPESWRAWRRPEFEYGGLQYLTNLDAPLFIHQYSHAWFDFRGVRDAFADYFENSVKATRAHRQFCLDLRGQFPHFSDDLWGITASDSARGYLAWGGPPQQGPLDGTLVPCAAAGSLPFLPSESLRCLKTMRGRFGDRIWSRYGFVDAFNPASGWTAPDVIGIDVGITLLMAENLRTGFIWRQFMKNREARRAMELAGFHKA